MIYNQLKTNPNNIILKGQYKQFRNDLNNSIKKEKAKYYKQKIEKNKSSSKNLWEVTNEYCGIYKNKKSIISSIKNDIGNKVINDYEKANIFNVFFSTVGKSLADENHISTQCTT